MKLIADLAPLVVGVLAVFALGGYLGAQTVNLIGGVL